MVNIEPRDPSREAVVTAAEADVRARLVVRAMEILESVRLIEEALGKLPKGPTRAETGFPVIVVGGGTLVGDAAVLLTLLTSVLITCIVEKARPETL